jgi:hypothetical protein
MANPKPRVWLVIGDKLGDNAQVEIIAEALGWPWERRQLVFRDKYVLGKPRFAPSLYHVDALRSDPLQPPWPDLVITIGRRPSMVALWIRKQSGQRTRIVLLGRPKRAFGEFDLIIATGQYRLPERPNVLHLDLPLMRVDEAAVAAAAADWTPRLARFPRPLVAVLVGGPTKPFVMDGKVASRLLEKVRGMIAETGGTLYISTSRRTPQAVVDVLEAVLPPGGVFYRWQTGGTENPYRGLLGLADRFVVTGDSVSMMVEVARLGKPLAIFPLPNQPGLISWARQALAERFHPPANSPGRGGLATRLGDLLYRLGIVGYSRDLTAVHRLLFRRALAVRLGDPFLTGGRKAPDELKDVVARIKALTGEQ